MPEQEWLADQFETHRAHLRRIAYRILGSQSEAEDAVQEAWLRLSRSDPSGVQDLRAWLTTVVARICLDMLRTGKSRREEPLDTPALEPLRSDPEENDPEYQALLADSVGLALLVVLDTLSPEERIAFVLHDLFSVPFTEIAPIVGRSPTAARQLASRARRRVRGAPTVPEAEVSRQRAIVEAFLAASRVGDLTALLALLDPGAAFRADRVAGMIGAPGEVHGAPAVANLFKGHAQGAQLALVNGAIGAVFALEGKPRGVFRFTIRGDKIVKINLVADPESIRQLEWAIL